MKAVSILAALVAIVSTDGLQLTSEENLEAFGSRWCRYKCPENSSPYPHVRCLRGFRHCICDTGYQRGGGVCNKIYFYDTPEKPAVGYCALTDSAGYPTGSVTFTQVDKYTVKVEGSAANLTEGKHGWHIHAVGDLSNPTNRCANTGSHYNPTSMNHGNHSGDLGNLVANADGMAYINQTETAFKVREIYGRGIIIHGGEDDLGLGEPQATSLTNGNAGPRVQCCVIGRGDIP